nr:unnamed protein product [Callosobruchus analis]
MFVCLYKPLKCFSSVSHRYGVKNMETCGDKVFISLSYSPRTATLRRKFGNLPVRYMRMRMDREQDFKILEKVVRRYHFNLLDEQVDDLDNTRWKKENASYTSSHQLLKVYLSKFKRKLSKRKFSHRYVQWEEVESCFNKRIKSGIITNINVKDPIIFMKNAFRSFRVHIRKQLKNSVIKANVVFVGVFKSLKMLKRPLNILLPKVK